MGKAIVRLADVGWVFDGLAIFVDTLADSRSLFFSPSFFRPSARTQHYAQCRNGKCNTRFTYLRYFLFRPRLYTYDH